MDLSPKPQNEEEATTAQSPLLIALKSSATAPKTVKHYTENTKYVGFSAAHAKINSAAKRALTDVNEDADDSVDELEAAGAQGMQQELLFAKTGVKRERDTARAGVEQESKTAQQAVNMEREFIKKAIDDVEDEAEEVADEEIAGMMKNLSKWRDEAEALSKKYKGVLSSVSATGVQQEKAAIAVAVAAVKEAAVELNSHKSGAALLEVSGRNDDDEPVQSAMAAGVKSAAAAADAAVSQERAVATSELKKEKLAGEAAVRSELQTERKLMADIVSATRDAVYKINKAGAQNHDRLVAMKISA